MTKRIRNPRYGMVVTDATGTWMLITRRDGRAKSIVWWAAWLGPWTDRPLCTLLLDPDQFGEVE